MIVSLSRSYPSRQGVPVIAQVDTAIFTQTYFIDCMGCTFCQDACCTYGVCIDPDNVARLAAHADTLAPYLGSQQDEWMTGHYVDDPEYVGGRYTRTRVVDGACVFLNRQDRGCMLHAFCIKTGQDYHLLKPMLCCIFPVTFEAGVLGPAVEVIEASLICLNGGRTLYRGVRDDLQYYFGEAFVRELDALESRR